MSDSHTQSANLKGQKLAGGRFHIFDLLGSGGMAEVYRAKDTRSNRDVAVKIPKPHLMADEQFVKRFQLEINTMKGLKHPHIVEVLFAGRHHDLLFAVFPFMMGGSLKHRIRGRNPLCQPPTTPDKLQWLVEIATALDYLHGQQLLHRDVKPDNILFDGQGKAYLGDFGVVRALQPEEDTDLQSLTATGAVLGTAPYMAPDLILGKKPYTGKVDQYALGVTVYEVLAGNRPFQGQPQTVLILHTQTPPVPLSQKRPDLPRSLASSVHRALAKTPDQRFPSCVAFAQSVITSLEQAQRPAATPPPLPPSGPFAETAPYSTNSRTALNPPHAAPAGSTPSFPAVPSRRSRKKFIWIGAAVVALLLIIVAFLIFRPKDDPAIQPVSIVGTWHETNGNSQMEFTKNGGWMGSKQGGQNLNGTYALNGNELHIRKPLGWYKYNVTIEGDTMTLDCFSAPQPLPFVPNVELNRIFHFERLED